MGQVDMELDYSVGSARQNTQHMVEQEAAPVQDTKEAARALALGEQTRLRGENGQFKKAPTQEEADAKWFEEHASEMKAATVPDSKAAQQEQAPEASKDAPEQAKESKEPDVDEAAIAAARTRAKRLQIPAKALDAMTPAEIVEADKAWQAQIAENGKLSQRSGELEKQIEAMKTGKDAAPAKASQPATDLDEIMQPFVADFDESTRKSLSGIAKAIHSQAQAAVESVKAELASVKESLAKVQTASGNVVAESIRGELKGKYPQLGKAGEWGAVMADADELLAVPKYRDNPRLAIEHAAAIRYASSAPAAQVSESTDRGKRNGVAGTASQAPRAKGKQTLDDVDAAWFARNPAFNRAG